jgi:hypothetical protein
MLMLVFIFYFLVRLLKQSISSFNSLLFSTDRLTSNTPARQDKSIAFTFLVARSFSSASFPLNAPKYINKAPSQLKSWLPVEVYFVLSSKKK